MKPLETIKEILLAEKELLHSKVHVADIGISGSFARGEQEKEGDVDILDDIPSLDKPLRNVLVKLNEHDKQDRP